MNDQQRLEISRGEQAKRLLDDPLMQEILSHLKASVRDQLFELPVEAKEQREMLFLMDRARAQFERAFQALIMGGEMAKNELLAEEHTKAKLEAIKERVYG